MQIGDAGVWLVLGAMLAGSTGCCENEGEEGKNDVSFHEDRGPSRIPEFDIKGHPPTLELTSASGGSGVTEVVTHDADGKVIARTMDTNSDGDITFTVDDRVATLRVYHYTATKNTKKKTITREELGT